MFFVYYCIVVTMKDKAFLTPVDERLYTEISSYLKKIGIEDVFLEGSAKKTSAYEDIDLIAVGDVESIAAAIGGIYGYKQERNGKEIPTLSSYLGRKVRVLSDEPNVPYVSRNVKRRVMIEVSSDEKSTIFDINFLPA